MKWVVPVAGLATTGMALTVAVTMHFTQAPAPSSQSSEPERFIVDVDHAMDDTFALALALRSPELKIIGITMTPHPEARQQARFVARLLRELGQDSIPISLGTSLLANSCRCGHWDAISQTLGVDYPAPIHESAAEFIVRQANSTPGRVSVLTFGPLTNLADALARDPGVAEKISRVVMLGGRGRATGAACHEYNVSTDIAAAQRVFASGIPVLMVSVDMTSRVTLCAEDLGRALAGQDGFSQVLRIYWEANGGKGFCPHDLLAVLAAVDERAFSWAVGSGPIGGNGCLSFGRSEEGSLGLATSVDVAGFHKFVLERLRGVRFAPVSVVTAVDSDSSQGVNVDANHPREKVMLDVYYVSDDLFALAVALRSPELVVVGVTQSQRGSDIVGESRVVARLLSDAGRPEISFATNKPYRQRDSSRRAWEDRVKPLGSDTPAPLQESGGQLIVRMANESPGEITLITVGPLTNLAEALRRDPSVAHTLRRVVMLGGSISQDYELTGNPTNEANVHLDVPAAQAVFSSGLPILMVGLDASAMLEFDSEKQKSIGNVASPLNGFLQDWCEVHQFRSFTPFDVMAVAMAIDQSFCEVRAGHVEVTDDGYTRLDPNLPANIEYCVNPNVEAFDEFMRTRLGVVTSQARSR